ncbi:serine/threonine-protein kinase [Tautonia rosea]|uniref:serine/threonine-protein kinase n=1 Tax=Tautonia rosea TaxID=2728037 RepID=UPI001475DE95|nr:serine/threonine-protein kinase [Tautonia rosea]
MQRPAAVDHPDPDRLFAFARGEIEEHDAQEIERHLASCERCRPILEGSADDSLIGLLRWVAPTEPDAGSAVVSAPAPAPAPAAPAPAPASPLPEGYELIGPIGRGGMGIVTKARQRGLGRVVALKRIRSGPDADPYELVRFRAEAEAAACLQHPNIVQIFNVGRVGGQPYIAMEYVSGGTLTDRLASGPMRPREAASLIETLALAVDHAHRSGVIHRDIKPGNVLLTEDGRPKLADFGLAKRLDTPGGATRSGALLGTPQYMAPEQAAGRTELVGPPADIYALGAVLFECLTGRPPFIAPSPIETLDLVRTTEPPTPGRLQPGIPIDLQTICLKCLEKDPARRYESAVELAADLARFSAGEPIRARATGPIGRGVKWVRRRPSQAIVIGLSLLILLSAGVGIVWSNVRLRQAIDRAESAAEEASLQRRNAEENYRDAREALRRVLDSFADSDFAGLPRLSELHRVQAEAALEFFDRAIARANGEDATVQLDTAQAAVEAANLEIVVGRPERAEIHLCLAAELLDDLRLRFPDDLTLTRERMVVSLKRGVMGSRTDLEQSVTALEEALSLAEAILQADPESRSARSDVAWCSHNLGAVWHHAGHGDRAEPHYRRAVTINSQLVDEAPDDLGKAVELAQNLINLGLIDAGLGNRNRAEDDYQRAAELLDHAVSRDPEHLEYVATMADLAVNRGILDVELGRLDSAIARYREGLSRIHPLLTSEPNMKRLRGTALNLHGSRAQALMAIDRFSEAIADWERVIELAEPGTPLRSIKMAQSLCVARSGDYRGAAQGVRALLDHAEPPLSPIDDYNLACILAIASSFASLEAPGQDHATTAIHQDLLERSMSHFRSAIAQDPSLIDLARKDPDFEALRPLPQFVSLLDDSE